MKAASVISLLGAGAGVMAQSNAFDNVVQQAMDDFFNIDGADVSLPQAVSVPPQGNAIDIGSLFDGLSSYMSDLTSSFDTWLGSSADMVTPTEAQNYQSASQSMAGVLDELNKVRQLCTSCRRMFKKLISLMKLQLKLRRICF